LKQLQLNKILRIKVWQAVVAALARGKACRINPSRQRQTRQRRHPATRTPPFEAVKMRKWARAALYRALTIERIQ
jgi:hypothetical protein